MKISDAQVVAEAWSEMNAIFARDGAPSGVSEEYWSSILKRLDALLLVETGHGAHCHPALYARESQPDWDEAAQSRARTGLKFSHRQPI